jgi:hypothetical protein
LVYVPAALVDHAHDLDLAGFLRQHFRYGRGAFFCRVARARRGQAAAPVEPPRFYLDLAGAVARAMPRGLGWLGLGLAFASQAAHTLGFFWEQRLETQVAYAARDAQAPN